MTLTVTVGLVASGNSSTRRPLASVYSVMPSIEAPCVTPAGSAATAAPATARKAAATRRPTKRVREKAMGRNLVFENGRGGEYSGAGFARRAQT